MEIVHGLPQPINERPTILVIGAFDGVHKGHQHIIGNIVQRARGLDCQSAVLTFDPHPDLVIHPEQERRYLGRIEERMEQIAELGVDLMIVLPFTRDTMALNAQTFMAQLCRSVALRELWIGWDFALGRGREGNYARLRQIGQTLGYSVHLVDALILDGQVISSTRIRALLSEGSVELAARLLGRPFSIHGPIIQGDRRGRTLGFPTANIQVDSHQMLPSNGIYVCRAQISDHRYGAVVNVGTRPTFAAGHSVEAYLLDFVGDIYGETLHLSFLHRLRDEQKFDSVTALIDQISRDISMAREWLKRHPD